MIKCKENIEIGLIPGAETLDHFFIHYDFGQKAWAYVAKLSGLSFCMPKSIEDSLAEGLSGWNLRGKTIMIGSCVAIVEREEC